MAISFFKNLIVLFVLTRMTFGNIPASPVIEGTICKGIDIRNGVDSFMQLENCSVIEGSLSILLIDDGTREEYRALSFPKLVEITDYLLLYRVYGLTTLSNIFPNLSVIRGQQLFFNFALVAFEMMDLEELGLIGLTVIERGAVRLEKNPMLCYIDTIDWTRIATHVDPKDHFIKGNRLVSECIDLCPDNCIKTRKSDSEHHRMVSRCWTMKHCQRNLDCPCSPNGFCMNNTKLCCHDSCLGGCTGDSRSDCNACKDFIFTDQSGRSQCIKTCLPGTYTYKNRRCFLDYKCLAYNGTLLNDPALGSDQPGQCVSDCPVGFTRSSTHRNTCERCNDTCPKECFGKKVDSVEAAQRLRGCTKLNGALEIRIKKGSHIQQELEENLGQITEITEYVWIHNSHALLSLNFFKKLRIIGGNREINGYSLVVKDNENIQALFTNNVTNDLQIKNGNMLFYYNRKLCLDVIKKFEKIVRMPPNVQNNIGNTNGDMASCSMSNIRLMVYLVTARVAFIRWDRYTGDKRALISYVIKYKEAPYRNVSILEGRDACSEDLWKTRDRSSTSSGGKTSILLVQLKPWTQYAVFVQTYTTSDTHAGARSKLIYFKTKASMPNVPSDLTVNVERLGELHVSWNPPADPNGIVTHYEVYWRRREFHQKFYAARDYCNSPLVTFDKKQDGVEGKTKEHENMTREEDAECCKCGTSEEDLALQARERNIQIEFQNHLQNSVYHKRPSKPKSSFRKPAGNMTKISSKRKRHILIEHNGEKRFHRYRRELQNSDTTVSQSPTEKKSDDRNDTEESSVSTMLKAVVNATEMIIPNLGYFEDYNIEVIACHDRNPRYPNKVKFCSNRAVTVGRTLKSDTADNLNSETITAEPQKNKTGLVTIKWKNPPYPNGPIIKYSVEYDEGGLSKKRHTICTTYMEYRKINGTVIPHLLPGNYSYRIRAYSLAGAGEWSQVKTFLVNAKPDSSLPITTIIAITVTSVTVVVVVTVIIGVIIVRRRMSKIPEILSVTVNPEYMMDYDEYIPDEWEVDRDKISLLRELGQGSFGMVWEGKAKDIVQKGKSVIVAVKTVNDKADFYQKMSFLKEASIMKGLKCHHVVQLLGIVSQGQPSLVIMELMSNGDLKTYLRRRRPENEEGLFPPTLKQIWQMAGEIADGMAYLSDRKFVHRDLAARNCMVSNNLTVKIGDFGMARDVYETDYYRKGGKGLLPVRWMGPESLKDGVFTSYSDVWSYGVVLWEMVTLAEIPYKGLAHEQVIKYVLGGKVIEQPEGCPDRLYQLMHQCWQFKEKQRPTFKQIIEIIEPELDPSFIEKSYFFSEENHVDHHIQQNVFLDEDGDDFIDDTQKPFIPADRDSSSYLGSYYSDSNHSIHSLEEEDEEIKCLHYNNECDQYRRESCDSAMCGEVKDTNCSDGINQNNSFSDFSSAIDTSDGSKDSCTVKHSHNSYLPNNINIANGPYSGSMQTTEC